MNKNKEKDNTIRISKFINTSDDWSPNYNGNQVKVSLLNQQMSGNGKQFDMVRIMVWGADDFGLEMDFYGTREQMNLKFNEWKKDIYDKIPEPCTKQWFKNRGFYNA